LNCPNCFKPLSLNRDTDDAFFRRALKQAKEIRAFAQAQVIERRTARTLLERAAKNTLTRSLWRNMGKTGWTVLLLTVAAVAADYHFSHGRHTDSLIAVLRQARQALGW